MTIPEEILELWKQHSAAGFPAGFGNRAINGIDIPLLDAEIGGCIRMFIHADGRLERREAKILHERLIDLNSIVLLLESGEIIYFNRLIRLANLILDRWKDE
jgi:hypothetical protein